MRNRSLCLDKKIRLNIEELPPERKELLHSGNGRQVPCCNLKDSSLDLRMKDRDLSRAARSKHFKAT